MMYPVNKFGALPAGWGVSRERHAGQGLGPLPGSHYSSSLKAAYFVGGAL